MIPTTVFVKYDDTHSDQEFSESEIYPLSAWAFRRRFQGPRGGSSLTFTRNEGIYTCRDFLVRMGFIMYLRTQCTLNDVKRITTYFIVIPTFDLNNFFSMPIDIKRFFPCRVQIVLFHCSLHF